MPKRLFGFFSGSTPTQFLLRARINLAQQLLSESTLSVRAIAQGLGYGDIYFFSRQFKSKCGLSPQAFRVKQRKGTVVSAAKC